MSKRSCETEPTFPPSFPNPQATAAAAFAVDPKAWADLRAALEGGDPEGTRGAAARLHLDEALTGLMAVCLSEYQRLGADIEAAGDPNSEWLKAEAELPTLLHSRAATREEAQKIAVATYETQSRRDRAWGMRGQVEAWQNQRFSIVALARELFSEVVGSFICRTLPQAIGAYAFAHKIDLDDWRNHGRTIAQKPRKRFHLAAG